MHGKVLLRMFAAVCLLALATADAWGQTPSSWTWDEVRTRFQAGNPTLRAGQIGIEESKAQEITAFLRPNPTLGILADQIDPFPGGPSHGPFAYLLSTATVNYLHERQHKRELRLESAKEATDVTVSGQSDLERNLLFALRSSFVGILQAKAVRKIARDNLDYWDHVLSISRDRFQAGDLARIDLDRLELLRVQFEADVQMADVNLRTSKIALLTLLNDRTPVDQVDVMGLFEYHDRLGPVEDFRQSAQENRPDLKAALQTVIKAKTDHKLAVANGSTDPILQADVGRNPPIDAYFGVGVNIPLRVFDRNQGEKLRTQLDIDRTQKLADATQAQVFNDVDSAYTTVNSTLILLRPYKEKYLQQAVNIRETVRFSWEHGGASLLDFLNAEQDYRGVQLSYVNLVGAYMTAAAQLNMAVGREALQ